MARGELPAGTVVPAVADLLYSMVWGLGFYAGLVADRDRVEAVTKQLKRVLHEGLLVGPVATETGESLDRVPAGATASS